eukprot:m.888272 g.888272  ORF g.888272 m.888272 type:complete len:1078 (+) comp23637_c0_seq1:129-3362(+)
MLEFIEAFSVAENVLPCIRERPGGISPPDSDSDRVELLKKNLFADKDAEDARVRIVGQELGFLLLFTWDGHIGSGEAQGEQSPSGRRTFIELLNLETGQQSLLYAHNEVTEIVGATVNHECTLLGFTTLVQYNNVDEGTGFEDVYESYLVVVQSQRPMLFNFNTPRHHFQRVQFLYGESDSLSHLLLFRHKEAIDVYAIHTGKGPQGIEIVEPLPHSDEIARRFIWFQFDLSRQCVYFLYLRPSQQCALGYDTMLKCVQFTSKNRYEIKMDVALPLEALWAGFADHRTEYINMPCSHSLVFTPFNMEVVHMGGGGLCVCFQHAPSGGKSSGFKADGSMGDPVGSECSISYSVFVLHHGCTLAYTVPMPQIPPDELSRVRLHFSAVNDLLMVYVPGHVLQLVDCGPRHEPGHHLILLGDDVPTLPPGQGTESKMPPSLSYFELIRQVNGRNAYGLGLFDVATGTAYTYEIDREYIFSLFTMSTTSLATKTLAMHLAIVHLADPSLVRRVMEYFFAVSPEGLHPELLKEYLISNAYMNMQQHTSEREFLRLLPITSIPTYYQELHGGAAGNAFANECPVQYFYSKLDAQALKEGTLGKLIQGDPYDSLYMQKTEQEVSRFSFDILHDKLAQMRDELRTVQRDRRGSHVLQTPQGRKEAVGPTTPTPAPDTGKKLGFFSASMRKRSFFSLSPKKPPSPVSSAASGRSVSPAGGTRDRAAAGTRTPPPLYSGRTPAGAMTSSPDDEARLLQQRTLHYLHLHLVRLSPGAAVEQCLDWANDYHNCQFLQSTEVFRLMANVRTSPATVAAVRASVGPSSAASASTTGTSGRGGGGEGGGSSMRLTKSRLQAAFDDASDDGTVAPPDDVADAASVGNELMNDKILFQLMERLYTVIQEISFPYPQGFHQRFVALAYRSLPRAMFKQHVAMGVARVSEEFVMRTLDELYDRSSRADERFKHFLVSQLEDDAMARALKRWPHPESQRSLADATVVSILADADRSDSHGHDSGDDVDTEPMRPSAGRVSFPPLRSFMRHMAQQEAAANTIARASLARSIRVPLGYIEDAALLDSMTESRQDILDVSF